MTTRTKKTRNILFGKFNDVMAIIFPVKLSYDLVLSLLANSEFENPGFINSNYPEKHLPLTLLVLNNIIIHKKLFERLD